MVVGFDGTLPGNANSMYFNGAAQSLTLGRGTVPATTGSNSAIAQIGQNPGNNDDAWIDVILDDVRIYCRALSPTEVAQLYKLGTVIIRP